MSAIQERSAAFETLLDKLNYGDGRRAFGNSRPTGRSFASACKGERDIQHMRRTGAIRGSVFHTVPRSWLNA